MTWEPVVREDEGKEAATLGRRSLLKKGAAAGAIGLAAPLTIDSFFSPAAATSHGGPTITPTVHFGGGGINTSAADWRMTTDNLAAFLSPSPVTPVAGGGLMLVVVTFHWNDTAGGVIEGDAGTNPQVSVTDTLGSTYSQHALFQFHATETPGTGGNGVWLAAFTAPVSGTTARSITVSFNDPTTSIIDDDLDVDNFLAHVFQLVPSTGTLAVSDTAQTAELAYSAPIGVALTSATNRAEVVVFASAGAIQSGAANLASWPAIGSPGGFSELADSFANDDLDISLQTNLRTTATTAAVSNSQTVDVARSTPASAGALALAIDYLA